MISKVILLLLPAVAMAEISINIFDDNVQFVGEAVNIISDAERDAFGLNVDRIKDAVNKYDQGRPDYVFLHSPTLAPVSDPVDLYKVYKEKGFKEVMTTLKVRSARILEKYSVPQIIATKNFHNDSPINASYTGTITQVEENTVTHKWTTSGSKSFSQEINYNVELQLASVGGKTSFSFQSTFGKETVNTVSTKLGSELSITLNMQPGQRIKVVLQANKGSMDVEVEYEASLSGCVASRFEGWHKEHRFWCYDINTLLDNAELPRTVVLKEVLNIGFYADESVTAYDGN